ncbi:molybdate transporter family protein [Pontibaca salina]|uniref:Sulfate/molybdate transporter n=1 Tax=Pontibaca salina TaxID=2795731 RepID=A0A934HNA8_9RHOB|nr:molybdate transporter family protein [Pontibaca salina]MBI6628522.1 putative sulfate/molybdate transporter [Pontibaca salina]
MTERPEIQQHRLRAISGEISGSFGDLGTFLPYVVAIVGAGVLMPAPVFLGFAAGYAMVALIYRVPIAVQPMKALGAMIIAGGLGVSEIAWSGAAIGLALLLFASNARFANAARAIPQSVITGLQAGLGLILGWVALGLMAQHWGLAVPALAVLALSLIAPRGPWVPVVLIAAVLLGPAQIPASQVIVAQGGSALGFIVSGIAAQLPLTLLNAVVVTAAVARALYPNHAARVSERRLAATTGILNLIFVPLGALPMCHGAGGVTAHHRFGARGAAAPLLLALLCGAGALAGPKVMDWLMRIPLPVVGALLLYAAADLVLSRRMFDARPDCRPVIGCAAVVTFFFGAFAGLIAGLLAETIRVHIKRGRRAESGDC